MTRYYIIDITTLMVMDVASTPRLRDEKYAALVEETGLFIWQTIEARSRKELHEKLVAMQQREQDPYALYDSQRSPVNYVLESRSRYERSES